MYPFYKHIRDEEKSGPDMSPLHQFSEPKSLFLLGAFLDKGICNIDGCTQAMGYTPLMCAVISGSFFSAKLLLMYGADLARVDSTGRTVLMLASYFGQHETVELFLEEGASIETADESGRTALYHALDCQSVNVVQLLLKHGAIVNTGVISILEMLLDAGADPCSIPSARASPLYNAVLCGNVDVIRCLLAYVDADKLVEDERFGYESSITSVILFSAMRGLREVLPVVLPSLTMENQAKLLLLALRDGHQTLTRFVLSLPNFSCSVLNNGNNIMKRVVIRGMYKEVQWLLEAGLEADMSAVMVGLDQFCANSGRGMNASDFKIKMYARAMGKIDSAKFLLFRAVFHAPAARSKSWCWLTAGVQTRANKTTKKRPIVVTWRRGLGRVVLPGLFRHAGKSGQWGASSGERPIV